MKLSNIDVLEEVVTELGLDLEALAEEHNQYCMSSSITEEEALNWLHSLPIETLSDSLNKLKRTKEALSVLKKIGAIADIEKVKDVSQMPEYIKEDWINYNKKPLNIPVLNQMIKSYENQLKSGLERPFSLSEPSDDELEDLISLLKSLRRDLIINKVI